MATKPQRSAELEAQIEKAMSRQIWYGSDQVVQTTPQAAIEASLTFEQTSGNSQGSTGGCSQDPSNVPSKSGK
jgi:hypothetical protein